MTQVGQINPDIHELLEKLHETVSETDNQARIYDASTATIVKRISQETASLTGIDFLRPDVTALTQALRTSMQTIQSTVRMRAVGTVQRIGDGVATLSGLPRSSTEELVTFPTGVQGMILNLEHDLIDVIMLGTSVGIQGGDLVTGTGERLSVPVGHNLLGRILNPLGRPLDDRGSLDVAVFRHLDRDAPGIVERTPVNESLLTGWKVVDALVPIGKGQRELIVGDRQTGKTSLAVDTIINQKERNVACIYVAIGQKKSTSLSVIETLRRTGAMEYTTVIISSPDDPPAMRYLAPYTGCTMAEGIMHEGRDVLIIYDDLSKHADAYRELSLLLRRPPGREAYPGDIFYLHSRLLERACRLSDEYGGGSITALPIVETQRGNMAAYIPTNLISITDGQILLDADLFNQGTKPAVDVGRSVSRVGGAAQSKGMRSLASTLRLELAQFEEVARFARFGTEVDETTHRQIQRGERWRRLLSQGVHQPLSLATQLILLKAASEGLLDNVPLNRLRELEAQFSRRFEKEHPTIIAQMERTGEIVPEQYQILRHDLEAFIAALD